MITRIDFPPVTPADGEHKTGCANPGNSLPVIGNPHAQQYGFEIKLIPLLIDGQQTAWEQVHVNSRLTEVRCTSPSRSAPTPFVDYDPIIRDAARRPRKDFRPCWTGD